ncbi:RES family NAD+ phosphorylase [Paenibacillus sp. FSL H7-0690]|uniref:RES family NAD+ phosphorylase n=1 Tax=Paenibacillus sp. FSL H7-0690 TaxID=2921437 RepID=UPI0030EC9C6D
MFFFFFFNYIRFAQKYGIEISVEEMKEFEQVLIKHPMLGTKSPVGEKLFEAIRFHKELEEGRILYKLDEYGTHTLLFRGRNRKSDLNPAYTSTDMWAPPSGYSSHGRYNSIGVPVLYLADDKAAVPYEIHTAHDEDVDIGTFQLERNLLLFDIGEFNNEFEGFVADTRIESRQLKHSYLIPNFIGACCNYLGYDGVIFKGTRGHDLHYTNYGLFNYKDGEDLSIVGNPISYKQILERKLEIK